MVALKMSAVPVSSMALHRREIIAQRLVRIIFIIYWLLILEGVLRKWVLPQEEQILFFIRLPFVIGLYAAALYYRAWPRTSWPLLYAYILAITSILLLPIQFLQGDYGPRYLLIWFYGWHNYFFYIPLAFVIAENFKENDFYRLVRHTLWLGVFATPIVFLQFWTSSDSFFNQGGLNEGFNFVNLGAALGFVRPFGFFTSTAGQTQFVVSLLAIILGLWMLPSRRKKVSTLLLWFGSGAVISMIAMSGSRATFILSGIIVAGFFLLIWVSRNRRMFVRGVIIPIILSVSFLILYPLLFPQAFEVFLARWSTAEIVESYLFEYGILSRILLGFYDFIYYLDEVPLGGYLLGFGGNAASRLTWVQLPDAAYSWSGYGQWGEGGWPRHIIELGVVGLLFIAYRLSMVFWLARKVFGTIKNSKNPWGLLLFLYCSPILLMGQLGHSTVLGYIWFFLGFTLSQTRKI